MDLDATTLWNAWKADGDYEARDRIAAANMRLVYHVARNIRKGLQQEVELDELVGAGSVGLLQAVETFDPGRGLAFSTCAIPRIRGAILDELRRADVAGRDTRRREREIAATEQKLAAESGRPARAAQVAERMNVDVDTLHRWRAAVRRTEHVSLDRPLPTDNGAAATVGEVVADTEAPSIEDRIDFEQQCGVLRREFQSLSDRERTVLMLYYYDELKLREIAEVLSVTESRVCQIRMQALRKLRARLRPLREAI